MKIFSLRIPEPARNVQMITQKLDTLEHQIDDLIQKVSLLAQENRMLRQKLAQCHQERLKLQESNEFAASKVEDIISQLKEKSA